MSISKRFALYLAGLLLFSFSPLLLTAQNSNGGKQMTVTGCLKQGTDAHGYYITGQDGTMYEVMGKGLAEHVGHTVTVSGMEVQLPEAQEQKKEASEKSEAGGSKHVDMKVSNVKMVSTSCQ